MPTKPCIILDHDLGTNPDDFFAILFLLKSDSVDLKLLVSGNNYVRERALLAQKILENEGAGDIASLSGEKTGHIDFFASQYINGFYRQIQQNYHEKIKEVIDTNSDVVWVVIQGLSNLASFLKKYPDYADRFDVLHMGLSIQDAKNFIGGGTNIEADPLAAKFVYELQLRRMRVVGAHTTVSDDIRVSPSTRIYKKLEKSATENHKMLLMSLNDFHSRRGIWPALHDPLTASVAMGMDFVSFATVGVEFNDYGKYKTPGKTIVNISKKKISKPDEFMELVAQAI